MITKRIIFSLSFVLFWSLSVFSQQSIVSTGQEMSNSTGIVSVSVGQILYITNNQVVSGVQQPFLEQYILSVKSVENGDYINTGYYENEEVQLNAVTTSECSTFSSWSDNNTDNPRTVIVTGDATYTAVFEKIKYTITTESDNLSQGSATVSK